MPDIDTLLRAHGCTVRETAVAAALVEGLTLARVAQRLEISIHTARTHLKHVFRKTNTRRQADLVRLILIAAGRSHPFE